MKKLFLACVCSFIATHAADVTVALAANMGYAIKTLQKEFRFLHPHINLQIVLGSSGKLSAQIEHGAPYDLFLSANMKYPITLHKTGLALHKPVVYAKGALALFSVKEQDFTKGMLVLNTPEIKKIAIANPKTAPYGVATVEALKHAKLYQKVKKKLVYGESISQTIAYARTAADIGIVAMSSRYAPSMAQFRENLHWYDVDQNLYTPISQGMVLLRRAEGNVEVKAFYDFMLSAKAKEILHNFGYSTL